MEWLGVVVGMGFIAMMNPVILIMAFFLSKKVNQFVQSIVIGIVNFGCWMLMYVGFDYQEQGTDQIQLGIAAFLSGMLVLYLFVMIRVLFSGGKSVVDGTKKAVDAIHEANLLDKVKSEAAGRMSSLKKFSTDEYSDEYFEKALDELESNSPRKVTWAKCLALSGGDSDKAKAEYIKLRVQELSNKG